MSAMTDSFHLPSTWGRSNVPLLNENDTEDTPDDTTRTRVVPGGYLSIYLHDRQGKTHPASTSKLAKATKSTVAFAAQDPASPEPPPRTRKGATMVFHLDDIQRTAARLNVKDSKRILACFEQRQSAAVNIDAIHAKVASYNAAIDKERTRQAQLLSWIQAGQQLLPQFHTQKAAAEAQQRMLDQAIAAASAELVQVKRSLSVVAAEAQAMTAKVENAQACLQQQQTLATDLQEVQRQHAVAAERLARAKAKLRQDELHHEGQMAVLAQQTLDEAARLHTLEEELNRRREQSAHLAQFVARCSHDFEAFRGTSS
ncbi:hypothetical protein Ae201684_006534 [Aphanomyces euteiches]|uniref:Uncharacterized protein n=1 Tax=Aphanomyces euteiches TaxID=100861 RepID=A0A6G0XB28_9STRA|nr:hypothetical protein Ae201684_006534 [Aphanomyces euteiches]